MTGMLLYPPPPPPVVVVKKLGHLSIRIMYRVFFSSCLTDKLWSDAPLDALPALHRMPRVGEALTINDESYRNDHGGDDLYGV